MTPLLSLVTGTLNRPVSLQRLVKSIQTHTQIPWELVIADASDEPIENVFKSANITVIPERPRQGFVKGYNRAFQYTTGQWVIWLNDDAEVQPGYAKAAIDFMEANPSIGLGALYYAENKLPYRVWTQLGMIYANFGIISREFGNQIGWFDEDLTMYGSDNSLTFRVLLAGKGVVSIPAARVWHHVQIDKYKDENQKYRLPDGKKLHEKYFPKVEQMKAVYRTTKHLSGPEVIRK